MLAVAEEHALGGWRPGRRGDEPVGANDGDQHELRIVVEDAAPEPHQIDFGPMLKVLIAYEQDRLVDLGDRTAHCLVDDVGQIGEAARRLRELEVAVLAELKGEDAPDERQHRRRQYDDGEARTLIGAAEGSENAVGAVHGQSGWHSGATAARSCAGVNGLARMASAPSARAALSNVVCSSPPMPALIDSRRGAPVLAFRRRMTSSPSQSGMMRSQTTAS